MLSQNVMTGRLSAEKLAGYRLWLAQLDEEAREPGGDLCVCDGDVWEIFNPRSAVGRQVYESFSDDELLDVMIRTMDHPGHKPRYEEIYLIYKEYIFLRFDGLHNAKAAARRRMKCLDEQKRWPPDWSEHVCAEAQLSWMESRGMCVSAENREFLLEICEQIRRTGQLPEITAEVRGSLDRMGGCKQVLERMGIPCLNKQAKKHLQHYWAQ